MSAPHNDRIVIAVDLDYFFAQCEELRRPEIKGKPVVVSVYSGRTEDSGAVSTSNYVARKLGVKSGIPIVFAKRILHDNPEAVFLSIDKDYYEAVSERIMEIVRSHSTKFEQVSIDEAYLDVSVEAKGDYGKAQTIGHKIKAEIFKAEKLTCSVGVAQNKLLAKMAADANKPNGLTVLRPEEVLSFIHPLPVGKLLGIGPKTEKKMSELGIRTVGDLAKFDRDLLAKEFGRNLGPSFSDLARGIDDAPVLEREQEQLSRIITLKQDADVFDFGEPLRTLADDLAQRLIGLGARCRVVGIIAITSRLKAKNRARTLERPTNSSDAILSVASELFRSYFDTNDDSEAKIRRIGIKLSGLEKENASPPADATLSDFMG